MLAYFAPSWQITFIYNFSFNTLSPNYNFLSSVLYVLKK